MTMIAILGTLGFNFPIFISAMARIEFGEGAGEFGVLSSVIAIGSVTGALLSARRERPRLRTVTLASAGFGASMTAAALMPNALTFGLALVLVGFSGLTVMTTANGYVQTTTAPAMRGRVMGLYIAVFMGGTPIGAPLAGWVADAFGPRWSLGIGAASGFIAAGIAAVYWVRTRQVRRGLGPGAAAGRSRCATDATPRPTANSPRPRSRSWRRRRSADLDRLDRSTGPERRLEA